MLNVPTLNIPTRQNMRSTSTYSHHPEDEYDQLTHNPKASLEAHKNSPHKIDLTEVFKASHLFSQTEVISETALTYSSMLSAKYGAEIFLKREDQQLGST